MKYMIRQMQIQKIIGELKALEATFYDPAGGDTKLKEWHDARKIIKAMIEGLVNSF